MKLPELGVRRPVLTFMIFLGIFLLGFVSLTRIPIDIMPEIEFPSISVVTMYNGASAEDIENQITKTIEQNVSTVTNVKEVTSISEENVSVVTLNFNWGTDIDNVASDVRQAIDFASPYLPEDSEDPMIIKFDMSMMPVIFFAITADESYSDLQNILERNFTDPLRRIPGVALTQIIGAPQREIQINVDKKRLEAYNISISNITNIIASENVTMPAGKLKMGKTHFNIRVPGEFKTLYEIRKLIVGNANGTPIYLENIAEVKDSFKDIDRIVRINKKRGVIVLLQKQSDANTVTVAERVRAAIPRIEKNLPDDIEVNIVMDSSEFIEQSVTNLGTTIFYALFFVIIVVFIFLREIRGSIIIAITIPFALIIAFIYLFVGDHTINIMSLSALAIAIGMVVDNAIVIYENIYRHRSEFKEPKKESAIFGSSEVGLAIMASTITTISIFLPIMFVGGITGILFKELAIVVIIVLAASLFSSLTLTPMLASKFIKLPEEIKRKEGFIKNFKETSEKWFRKLDDFYTSSLNWSLNHRKFVLITGIIVFGLSLFMIKYVGTEFIPASDEGQLYGTIELPAGTRIEETDKIMKKVEDIIEKEVPEKRIMFARTGVSESGFGAAMGRRSDVNIITVGGRLVEKSERERSDKEIAQDVKKLVSKIPGIKSIDFSNQSSFDEAFSGGKPVVIEIYGYDLNKTDKVANNIKKLAESIPGLTDVTISREERKPELWVEIDRQKASSVGLNISQIANTIRTKFYGKIATKYREQKDEYDVFVNLEESDRSTIDDLKNIFLINPAGRKIPITSIARITERKGPVILERKDQERVIYVRGGLYKRPLGDVIGDLKRGLEKIDIPEDIYIEIGGSAEEQQEAFGVLLFALFMGIILIYMVLAAQFESLLDPFIIMFSVPFAIIGVIWALFITGKTLSIISFVGMIMLIGIVVNNAIVLVDYINIIRARGKDLKDAILYTGPRRLRPVLMTAFTTILGLSPLALRTGEGSEIWSPLAISLIGGLLVSTMVTLIFVPTLYSVFQEKSKRFRKQPLNGR